MYEEEFNKLKGKRVIGMARPFETGTEVIEFLCDDGTAFKLECYGDCCSHSWFEQLEMPEFPFTILSAEEISGKEITEEWLSKGSYECVESYGLKMLTDQGQVDLDMRNDSNGYYGGWFSLSI